jgi:hypothetical protein
MASADAGAVGETASNNPSSRQVLMMIRMRPWEPGYQISIVSELYVAKILESQRQHGS